MIKMFIDNEEVVSDREFTINEEMLSASSTILNNCYPKSWELTKDYVSNFYYPKDYSKFILASGEFEHGDEEYSVLNVSGETSIQFETNVEKEWNSFNVYGNTTQETRSGKNLFKSDDFNETNHDITFSNINNSLNISGTSTATYYPSVVMYADGSHSILNWVATTSNINAEKGYFNDSGDIIISVFQNGNRTWQQRIVIGYEDNTIDTYYLNSTDFATKTYTTNKRINFICIANHPNQTYNVTFKIMISKSGGDYEPYGVMPSPDYPSELVNVGYKNYFTLDYITAAGITKNDTETNDFTYTDCWGRDIVLNANIVKMLKPSTTYTIKYKYQVLERPSSFGQNNSIYNFGLYNGSRMIWLGITNKNSIDLNTWETITAEFTTPASLTNYRILAYNFKDTNNNTTGIIRISELIITEKERDFIPFGKYGIEVKTQGKNSFDKNIITLGGNWNGAIGTTCYPFRSATTRATILVPVKSNTNYYLSLKQSEWYIMQIMLSNKNYVVTENISSTVTNNINRLITTSSDTTYIGIKFKYGSAGTTAMTSDLLKSLFLQIEEGTQATEYEPYKENIYSYQLDEPLRSIGDTKDLLYIKNGMLYVERKIGSVVLNGSEGNWYRNRPISFPSDNYRFANGFLSDKLIKPSSNSEKGKLLCDTFKVVSLDETTSRINGIALHISGFIYIYDESIQTYSINDFKTWLSNHKPEVQYVLAEPYTEVIGQVNIPYSYERINNITFDTGIDTEETVYYYLKNYDILFAGIVKNSGDISLNPRYPHYCSLQILDYKTFLSESDTLDYVISNKTIREAIEMVVDSVSHYGFSLGTIDISNADDVIGAYSTLNKTAYDVLQYLADISGSRWRARYIDNSSMAIDFYEPDKLPQAEDIEYTQEYWEDNNIVDLTFNYGTRDYRNKQIVLSDEVYAGIDYNEIILSNGYNTNFITSQNVGIVKGITVNGVKKDVISQQERELGADADFYYTPGKNIIESSSSYTAGTQIAVIYTPLVKGRQIVFNNDEVDRIATQTDTIGVIARYESRNDVVSSAELEKIGETYIEYKGKAEIILTLTTHNKDLFNIGEVTYFNSPIDELKQKYMVKSKETQYIIESETGNINLFYVYELTSSFNSEKAINYFDNQRNKAQGNIQEGESITRNIDINSSAVIIWGNSSIEETTISVVGDNVLNSVLNSPFIE